MPPPPAFTYLNDGVKISGAVTYAELDAKARSLAAQLLAHCAPRDRVLLVYPPSLDYSIAFYACVYAEVIAMPALSPTNLRALPRLQLIADDAQASCALAPAHIAAAMRWRWTCRAHSPGSRPTKCPIPPRHGARRCSCNTPPVRPAPRGASW